MRPAAARAPETLPGALVRLVQALARLFESLDPRHLTKNQRFTLAFDILMLVFLAVCLFAGMEGAQRFILALAVLVILAWSYSLNFKS